MSRASAVNAASSVISDIEYSTIPYVPAVGNEVIKHATDERKYKAFTLAKNGLRVLVISDPTASRSACAIDVHVGAFSDPPEVPGIAHFCEHMTFLGTKKYPKEDAFSAFLTQNGGSSNAYTDSEDTVYYFDVNSDHLKEGLDRFSGFFEAPLFTPNATARELNAIESEHSKNINDDGFRMYQLERDQANINHPLNKFATGNKFTLETNALAQGIDIREKLLQFHNTYYSSKLMTLCVSGKQSVAELEGWVNQYFSSIPDRNNPTPAETQWWGKVEPYLPQSQASLLEIVPISEASRYMSIAWPIWIKTPDKRQRLQLARPEVVLSHLIGHESTGSVRSFLIKKGWANGIQASVGNDVADMQVFDVTVDLTEEGLKHRDDVTAVIFAYIDLLKTKVIPSYVYTELQRISQIAFDYSEKSDPSSYASSLVTNMQAFLDQPSLYITGPRLFDHADPALVSDYLSNLTPQGAHIKIISTEFKGKTDKVARYYGTEYNKKSLPTQTKTWSNVKASSYPDLAYPQPNDLIPTEFDLVYKSPGTLSQAEKDALSKAAPTCIRRADKWTVWHKVDKSFSQPKVYAVISLAIPKDVYDLPFVINSKIFSYCFLESLSEFLYDAHLAGLGASIEFTSKGFQLILSGFNDKLDLFATKVLSALKDFKPDKATYVRVKDQMEQEYGNWNTQQPYAHASYYATLGSESMQYKIEDLRATIKKIDISNLDGFLSKSLKRSYGTAMVIGNINDEDALRLTSIVEGVFPFTPLDAQDRSFRQVVEYPLATVGHRMKNPEPNENDINSAASLYFQLPSRAPKDYMYVELLGEVLEQPFFNSLRTQQQLGYIVFSGVKVREGVLSLAFIVQSSVADGAKLATCIEKFIAEEVPAIINKLTADDLQAFRDGIIVRKEEPDQRLTAQAGRFWGEIITSTVTAVRSKGADSSADPLFARRDIEVSALKTVTLGAFKTFAQEFLGVGGSMRRCLVSQVTSVKAPKSDVAVVTVDASGVTNSIIDIDDSIKWKETLKYVVD
jgi:insulysin